MYEASTQKQSTNQYRALSLTKWQEIAANVRGGSPGGGDAAGFALRPGGAAGEQQLSRGSLYSSFWQ